VGEDAMRGRIYLPVNELQQFDVKAHEILQAHATPTAFVRADAVPGPAAPTRCTTRHWPCCLPPDRRAQKPGLMMASIYRALLREIEADNFQVLRQRVSLTPLRGFWPGVEGAGARKIMT